MSLIDLYIKDNHSGRIHKIGDSRHDMLTVDADGIVRYSNLQNGDGGRSGCKTDGYSFVPNEDDYGYNIDPREIDNDNTEK